MFRFVLLLSSLLAKVSFAPFNGWCGRSHLRRTFVSSQPRSAAVAGSLFCRGRQFVSRQLQNCQGEFFGRSLPQSGALRFLLVLYVLRSLLYKFLRPPVVVMAGFKLRAWIAA
ncbi:hypothetical protein NDU88_004332 [Pleurodeles waltl]|uniref:Secreted protein n=1 Tax=Pleurodeles waltl TaxID=8319 RepID=A0AAV7UF75_PLEWA|nr:hypothetical protein NDU88_004332 [Pleurodeles waltl]